MSNEELLSLTNEALRIDDYPFTVRPLSKADGGGYLIEYPDIPGCISDGDSPEEAVHNGKDALRAVLLTKLGVGDAIPTPGSSVYLKVPAGLSRRLERAAEKCHLPPEQLGAALISTALDQQESAAT